MKLIFIYFIAFYSRRARHSTGNEIPTGQCLLGFNSDKTSSTVSNPDLKYVFVTSNLLFLSYIYKTESSQVNIKKLDLIQQ